MDGRLSVSGGRLVDIGARADAYRFGEQLIAVIDANILEPTRSLYWKWPLQHHIFFASVFPGGVLSFLPTEAAFLLILWECLR
jgi:hypothetical protein